jgi:hypothetical protein
MRDLKLWLEEAQEVMEQVEILESALIENVRLQNSNEFLRERIANLNEEIKVLELERKTLKEALEIHQERGNC